MMTIQSHIDLVNVVAMLVDHVGYSLRVSIGSWNCQGATLVEVDLGVDEEQDDSHASS